MREPFGLYVILTNPVAGYERCAEAAVAEGVPLLQLRMKGSPPGEVLAMARRLRSITRGSATRLIVNDDVDIAAACDADGVHLGQDDLPIAQARERWPVPGKLFGLSTHSEAQELAARERSPDYVGVGPLFPTPTKARPDPLLGLDRAAAIVRASPLPAVAIGGIDAANLASVLARGISNVAVVRAVCARDDPRSAIAELRAVWRAARQP